ncbi:hypothetical protein LBMAG53_33490 [Planctomycetota bacterium]|nr:hypothetical protein LBMAG53_33490 [Planctomycetota bacterium]
MNIYQPDGWNIRREPPVIDTILRSLHATEALTSRVKNITYQPQSENRGGGVHFAGLRRIDDSPVIIKVGAFRDEVSWTQAIAERCPDLGAELLASGMQLGDRAVGWLASRWIPYGPLGPLWHGNEFKLLMEAGVRFQAVAAGVDLPAPMMTEDRLRRVLQRAVALDAPGEARSLIERLSTDWAWLTARFSSAVCHGDLHLANALSHHPPPGGPAVLIDFQPIRQPWTLDAAYCHAFQIADPTRPGSQRLVSLMAQARYDAGLDDRLPESHDLERAEQVCRAWMALRLWQNPGIDRTQRTFIEGISGCIASALANQHGVS